MTRTKRTKTKTKKTTAPTNRRSCESRTRTKQDAFSPVTRSAAVISATAAMADNKSDCQKGVAMKPREGRSARNCQRI
jgi:hypothetical protein